MPGYDGTHNPLSPKDNDLAVYVWIFISIMAGVPLLTVAFLFSAPSHYDPYNPDFIEEIRPDRTMADVERIEKEAQESNPRLARPGEGYAHFNKHRETNKKLRYANSCTIVVLGDLARSPRMLYHAASLASHGVRVQMVGYVESPLPSFLKATKHIRVKALSPLPKILSFLPFPILAPLKLLHQSWSLYRALCYGVTTPTRQMLLQIPPSMPTLHVCLIACWARNTKLVCDWHNTGSSILALRFGRNHGNLIVRLAKAYELRLARRAQAHLTVSEAMKRYLVETAKIEPAKITVVRDRAAEAFKPLADSAARKDFLNKCEVTSEYSEDLLKLPARWKLLVSSTSWTADEDFSIMLDALVKYSAKAQGRTLPKLLVIITGKGPQKAKYMTQISSLNQARKLDQVVIRTAFLPHESYAQLLASADLGVSLHNSSSGLDLPMKVVDMFGTGLPVAAYSGWEAWGESMKEGVNARGFTNAAELADVLEQLFSLEGGEKSLETLKKGALKESSRRWEQEWDDNATKALRLEKN